MQNIAFRVPSVRTLIQTRSDNGQSTVTNTNSSSRFVLRYQSGYTGKKSTVKPPPIHDYDIHAQDFTLSQNARILYVNEPKLVTATGGLLDTAVNAFSTGQGSWALLGFNDGRTWDQVWAPLMNRALDSLNEKARGDLDLSVDFAESRQARRMFNAQDRVNAYAEHFAKRAGGKPLFAKTRFIANHWLEFTYGIKPLVSSVYGVADELIRVNINKTQRFSARATDRITPDYVTLKTYFDGAFRVPVVGGSLKTSVTYGCDLRTSDFDLTRWSSLNPASIAWELLPYSFVVDWFIDVGGYLRNLETALLYANRFRSGFRTQLVTGDLEIRLLETKPLSGETYRYNDQYGYLKERRVLRTNLTSWPLPQLPMLNARLGSSRLLSGAALLAQTLDGRIPDRLKKMDLAARRTFNPDVQNALKYLHAGRKRW